MLDPRRDDVALFRLGFEETANRGVVPLGAAAGENHLHRIGGADQRGDLRPRFIELLPNLAAEAMDARRIAVAFGEKGLHRLEDFGQEARRRVVIEVDFASHRSRPRPGQPTLPSRLTPKSFCASTANSIGSSLNTCLQNPLTIMLTASSVDIPRAGNKKAGPRRFSKSKPHAPPAPCGSKPPDKGRYARRTYPPAITNRTANSSA